MKKLLLILILMLGFQTLVKADDIRDFEIEGMSIGDSLLDYFAINEFTKNFLIKIKNGPQYLKLYLVLKHMVDSKYM